MVKIVPDDLLSRAQRRSLERFRAAVGWGELKLWRIRNPGRPFLDYYVDRVNRGIARGAKSTPLVTGTVPDDPFSRTIFAIAHAVLRDLQARGLSRTSRLVDYGCGSLRIGRARVGYLGTGCYTGLDTTDQLYLAGRTHIDPDLIASKQPSFEVISPQTVANAAVVPQDFIFCRAILQHVPPQDIGNFIKTSTALIGSGTTGLFYFKFLHKLWQIIAASWVYPSSYMAQKFRSVRPDLEIDASHDVKLRIQKCPSRS